MKHLRRLLSLCLATAFTALASISLAADSAHIVRAFAHEGHLYSYIDISAVTQPLTKADLKLGGQSYPAAGTLQTARQAGLPAEFMLLLDISTSMPDFVDDILAFADSLGQCGGEKTSYTLATFGDSFVPVSAKTDAASMLDALDAVQYNAKSTKIYSGLESALDYYSETPRQGNCLYNVVVLTDGVEYNKDGGITYDALLQRLGGTGVIVHTIGFGEDIQALDSLGALALATGGQHWCIWDTDSQAAAQAITDYLGSLLLVEFDISSYSSPGGMQDVSITFASGSQLVCRSDAQADIPAAEGASAGGSTGNTPSSGGTATTTAQHVDNPVENGNNVINPAVITASAGAAALVIALVIIFAKRRKAKAPARQASTGGIFMRLDVASGSFSGGSNELTLADELTIGRDKGCDIVFSNPSVARRNSRVFLANGAVYIEDLGSTNGTCVNGIPIEMPNLLRSGDEITVGDAVFRLKF